MIGTTKEAIKYLTDQTDKVWEVREHREKRSLNANNYFYALVSKIASKLGASNAEIHNQMIQRYGQADEDMKDVILRSDINIMKLEGIHLLPTGHMKKLDNGVLYHAYKVMRGSHTYNTEEMSKLIDGTVEEAKALGIETLTPAELERLKNARKD